MLTSFEQIREWITENGLKRWVLFKDHTRTEKIIDSQYFSVSDQADKLAMTEKYLRYAGGRAFAAGSGSNSANDLNITADIRLDDMQQPTNGVGVSGPMAYSSIGELREEITKSVRAELEVKSLKDREKEIERREKEFAEKEAGVWGMLINKVGPAILGKVLNSNPDRLVAGVDAEEPVHVAPIVVDKQPDAQPNEPTDNRETTETQPTEEQSPFTDEEADELFALMARWKKVEPAYLKMLRKVVVMAESNDSNYQLARTVLAQ